MINKNSFSRIDLILLGSVVALVILGILAIYSAGFDPIDKINNGNYKKQLLFFVVGIVIMAVISFINYQKIGEFSLIIYVAILLVLIGTTFFGATVRNTRAWIHIGPIAIQPSEFMKLGTVILLAKYMEIREREMHYLRELLIPTLITFVPVFFILLQPDTGTAIVYIPILFAMLFVAGADVTHLFSVVAIGVISMLMPMMITYREWVGAGLDSNIIEFYRTGMKPFIISAIFLIISLILYILHVLFVKKYLRRIYIPCFVFSVGLFCSVVIQRYLKDYQKKRILVFLNPDLDPHGSGYNVIQSKIAIGSGGLIGKGLLNGSQTQLGFLPEKSTDFIYPVIAEELGFLGALFVLVCFAVIIYKGIQIALNAKDKYSALLATGIITIFLCHIIINLGMVLGIMPVTGLPLCFLSYGGSNLVMCLAGVGILLNIHLK
jgi:rod shape determining protein RodA